jgi:catechol 2,3-dioxygenase-like lactoylglutathione lyase family enzyme
MNLNQVTLPATDIPRSVAFYSAMGFRQIVEDSHYARFLCPDGDATFSVHKTDAEGVNFGVVVYFETKNLDEKVQELKQLGFVFIQEPRDETWLWREARLLDPAGNIICLYFAGENRIHPPWRINS